MKVYGINQIGTSFKRTSQKSRREHGAPAPHSFPRWGHWDQGYLRSPLCGLLESVTKPSLSTQSREVPITQFCLALYNQQHKFWEESLTHCSKSTTTSNLLIGELRLTFSLGVQHEGQKNITFSNDKVLSEVPLTFKKKKKCLAIINVLSAFWFSWLSEAKTLWECLCGFDHRQSKETLCSFQKGRSCWKSRSTPPYRGNRYRTSLRLLPKIKSGSEAAIGPQKPAVLIFLSAFFFPAHSR